MTNILLYLGPLNVTSYPTTLLSKLFSWWVNGTTKNHLYAVLYQIKYINKSQVWALIWTRSWYRRTLTRVGCISFLLGVSLSKHASASRLARCQEWSHIVIIMAGEKNVFFDVRYNNMWTVECRENDIYCCTCRLWLPVNWYCIMQLSLSMFCLYFGLFGLIAFWIGSSWNEAKCLKVPV